MRKIFMLVSLAILMVFHALTVPAAGDEAILKNGDSRIRAAASDTRALRRNIRVILTDPRFNYPERWGWIKKLWDSIHGWLAKLRLSQKSSGNYSLNKVLRWIGIGCLALLPFILLYLLPKLFVGSAVVKPLSKKKPLSKVGSEDLKDQAGIMAGKGQFREAIRLIYLVGLEDLKTNGIIPDDIRLTDKANMNIVNRALGAKHPCSQAFRELVLVFQEKWYGLRSCQAEDYYRLIDYLKTIEANTGKPHV